MKKERIISGIKRQVLQNDGKPLGVRRFEVATGIKQSDWLGKFWPRWGDALVEAGFAPNTMTSAHADQELLQPLVNLIREIGHFRTRPEQRRHRRCGTRPRRFMSLRPMMHLE